MIGHYTTDMLLIDASVYIFCAAHALPETIIGVGGRPLNAGHGYAGCPAGCAISWA